MTTLLKCEQFYAVDTYPLNDVFDGERGLIDAFDDELVVEKGPSRLRDQDLPEKFSIGAQTDVGGEGWEDPKERGRILFQLFENQERGNKIF